VAPENSDMAERTEPATPKRKEDARRKGQVAQSRELGSVAILWTAVLLAGSFLGAALVLHVARLAAGIWSSAGRGLGGLRDAHAALLQAALAAGAGLLPMLVLLALAGGLAALAQTGPMFSAEVLTPRASRLSPAAGFKRLFEPDRLFDLAKAIFKLGVVGSITFVVLAGSAELIPALLQVPIAESLGIGGTLARRVAVLTVAFLTAMAALDVLYVRWRHEKRLRMTRKEVRDEVKEREGSPHVRSRVRQLQREVSRSRMIQAASEASVVVTNPTHYAVALQYSRDLPAPRVLAMGRNHVAQRIREVAREHDIPIVENPPLARLLFRTAKVGQDIPESLYQAVAEVLAFVYRVDARRAREWGAPA